MKLSSIVEFMSDAPFKSIRCNIEIKEDSKVVAKFRFGQGTGLVKKTKSYKSLQLDIPVEDKKVQWEKWAYKDKYHKTIIIKGENI